MQNINKQQPKIKCPECNGTGEVEKTIYRGEEGMKIEMDVMVECPECEGHGICYTPKTKHFPL